MGLFDFLKGAGKSEAPKPEPKMTNEEATKMMRDHFIGLIIKHDLEIDSPNVFYENGRITINGSVKDQATKEKIVLTLGNVKGVEQVDDQMELNIEEAQPESRFYTVQKGDSLSKISKEVYGDAMKYPMIFEANKPMLSDPNLIYPGQMLRIPAE